MQFGLAVGLLLCEGCGVEDTAKGETAAPCTTTSYTDADGDGFGDPASGAERCDDPARTADSGDCNDAAPTVHPGSAEVPYDGIDNDCDPATRDEDLDGDGFPVATDCDDTSATVFPGAEEVCDRVDDDCDGVVDPSCHALLAHASTVEEWDLLSGAWVRSIALPPPDDTNVYGDARDICTLADGRIAVRNGTPPGAISVYDPLGGTWAHWTSELLHGLGNANFGGIACVGDYVYAANGSDIVRFATADGSSVAFGSGSELIDVAVGSDGRIYVLPYNGGPLVYDPDSLTLIEQIETEDPTLRGFAVTEDALLYGTVLTGAPLVRANLRGEVEAELEDTTGTGWDPLDIDLSVDGHVLVGTATTGRLLVTTPHWEDPQVVYTGVVWAFTTFGSLGGE